jgi:hypothetical protein
LLHLLILFKHFQAIFCSISHSYYPLLSFSQSITFL